jgi:hypothetical protein
VGMRSQSGSPGTSAPRVNCGHDAPGGAELPVREEPRKRPHDPADRVGVGQLPRRQRRLAWIGIHRDVPGLRQLGGRAGTVGVQVRQQDRGWRRVRPEQCLGAGLDPAQGRRGRAVRQSRPPVRSVKCGCGRLCSGSGSVLAVLCGAADVCGHPRSRRTSTLAAGDGALGHGSGQTAGVVAEAASRWWADRRSGTGVLCSPTGIGISVILTG